MAKFYSVVVSVLDEYGNRIDAHEISGCTREREALADRAALRRLIAAGKYNHLAAWGSLAADVEAHDAENWHLIEII